MSSGLAAAAGAALAHQGGWDEALFVLGPLIAIVLLLRIAKKRAERNRDAADRPER